MVIYFLMSTRQSQGKGRTAHVALHAQEKQRLPARSPLRAKITFLVRLNSHCDKDRWKQFNHDRKDIYNHVDTIWLLFHMTFLFLPPTSSEHQYQEYILVYSSSLMSMILSRGKI